MFLNVSLGFDGLKLEVQRLSQLLINQNTNSSNAHIVKTLQNCVQSAGQFVSIASSLVGTRSTSAGGSDFGSIASARKKKRIVDWIPSGNDILYEDAEEEHNANSSTLSPSDPFVDDVYNDDEISLTNISENVEESQVDALDPDLEAHFIQHWTKIAKSKFKSGEYREAEAYLERILKRSEALYGIHFKGRGEVLEMLVWTLHQQNKWGETKKLLLEQFDGRKKLRESLAADFSQKGNWDEAEKILLELLNETPSATEYIRLSHALAEVSYGRKDYTNAAKRCQQAIRRIKATNGMTDPSFHKSIDLIARIYEAQGDHIQAEGYRAIFLSEFLRKFSPLVDSNVQKIAIKNVWKSNSYVKCQSNKLLHKLETHC
jgi:hypothetical protein